MIEKIRRYKFCEIFIQLKSSFVYYEISSIHRSNE